MTETDDFGWLFNITKVLVFKEIFLKKNLSERDILIVGNSFMNFILFSLVTERIAPDLGIIEPLTIERVILNAVASGNVSSGTQIIFDDFVSILHKINLKTNNLLDSSFQKIVIVDKGNNRSIVDFHINNVDNDLTTVYSHLFSIDRAKDLIISMKGINQIYKNILKLATILDKKLVVIDQLPYIIKTFTPDNFAQKDQQLRVFLQKERNRQQIDGVYWTPKYITDYIVKETLIYYLRKNDSTNSIKRLIDEYKNNQKEFFLTVNNLTILDPSCGSGVFLLSVIDILSHLCGEIITENKGGDPLITPLHFLNSLYGVDKNTETIKFTRVILFLKLILNYKKDSGFSKDDFISKITTTLMSNIKCGNSIIDNRNYISDGFEWTREFPKVFKSNSRFNIIIGNPPWGAVIDEIKNVIFKEYYPETMHKGIDSYTLFLYHCLKRLLSNDGVLGFVIPNELCLDNKKGWLRHYLLTNCQLLEIINLGFDVFRGVARPAMILILRLSPSSTGSEIKVLTGLSKREKIKLMTKKLMIGDFFSSKGHIINQELFLENENYFFNIWSLVIDQQIIRQIEKNNFRPLGYYVKNGRGIDTNKQGLYIVCPKCDYLNSPFGFGQAGKISKKKCVNNNCNFIFLRKDVDKYRTERIFSDSDYSSDEKDTVPGYIGSDIHKLYFSRKPRAFKYFGDKIGDPLYERYSKILWKKPSLYQGEKLLIRKVSSGYLPEIMIHNGFLVFNQQVYCLKKKEEILPSSISLKFFLAIICSRLFYYYYLQKFADLDKRSLPHFTQENILSVPVPEPNPSTSEYKELIRIMTEIIEKITLFNNSSNDNPISKQRDNLVESIEYKFQLIDELVFSLYNISTSSLREKIIQTVDRMGYRAF